MENIFVADGTLSDGASPAVAAMPGGWTTGKRGADSPGGASADGMVHRLLALVDAMPLIATIRDDNGRVIDCNMEALRLFNLSSKAEFCNRYLEFVPERQPDGRLSKEKMLDVMDEVRKNGTAKLEWEYRLPDGSPLPVEVNAVRIPRGDSHHYICYSRDLRDLRLKEAEAKESAQRMQAMLDFMPFACAFWTEDGRVVDCNNRLVELFRCQDKQSFIKNFDDYSPEYQPDGQPSLEKSRRLIRAAYESERTNFIWEHRAADGSSLPVEITLIRIKWGDGYRVVGYLRDLSKLRNTQENFSLMSSIVEHSPRVAMFIGPFGRLEYVNGALCKLSGYSSKEILKRGMPLFVDKEDLFRLLTEYLPALEKADKLTVELTLVKKDGDKRLLSAALFALHMPGGKMGVGLTAADITATRNLQHELEIAKEKAERGLVQERRYSQAKNDFVSRMSHEMLTPVNIITGMAHIAATARDKKRRQAAFARLHEAAHGLIGIIDDILNMGRLEDGKLELRPREFSLQGLVDELGCAAAAQAKANGLKFAVAAEGGLPAAVVADGGYLRHTLWKLLDNALKYTEKGSVRLKVRADVADGAVDDDGRPLAMLRFGVEDTGPGIAPEARQRLWDTFEQEDNGITRRYGGTGLGLPIARRMALLLGGDITVESKPGAGSTFICSVPAGVAPEPRPGEGAAAQPPDPCVCELAGCGGWPGAGGILAASAAALEGCRILVVDDAPINREIVMVLLEETGAVFDYAEDGFEAVEKFQDNHYDIVLMDLHMPNMDGFEAARRIRSLPVPHAGEASIIAVTADKSAEVASRCLEAGMDACTGKPVDGDVLMSAILRCRKAVA